jgi:hypothetical protein
VREKKKKREREWIHEEEEKNMRSSHLSDGRKRKRKR